MTNNSKQNSRRFVVVVYRDKRTDEPTYLGTFNIDADVYNAVKECDRCGVARIENALRFTKLGAQRIAKGYVAGEVIEAP